MKKIIGFIFCLMILQVMSLLPAYVQTAEAQERQVLGFYITPKFGYSYGGYELDPSLAPVVDGFTGAIAVGYKFKNVSMRAEVESNFTVAWESYEIPSVNIPPIGNVSGSVDVEILTSLGFANIYYDFELEGKLTPYVGVGIGYAEVTPAITVVITDVSLRVEGDSTSSVAYNIGGGFSYELTPMSDLDFNGRYVYLADDEMSESGLSARWQFSIGLRTTF